MDPEMHLSYQPDNETFAIADGALSRAAYAVIACAKAGGCATENESIVFANITLYNHLRMLCTKNEYDPTRIFLHLPNGETTTLNRYCAIEHYADIPAPDTDAAEAVLLFTFRLMKREGK